MPACDFCGSAILFGGRTAGRLPLVFGEADVNCLQTLQLAKRRDSFVADAPTAQAEVLQFLHALQELEAGVGDLLVPLAE